MFVLDPFGDQKRFQDFGTISDTRNVTLVWSISRIGLPYKIDMAVRADLFTVFVSNTIFVGQMLIPPFEHYLLW